MSSPPAGTSSRGGSVILLLKCSLGNGRHVEYVFLIYIMLFCTRYFQTRPGARKMFPAFANVKIAELTTNRDFLSAAYNCVASLTYVIPHLKCDLLERCPAFNKLKKKDNNVDFKVRFE